MGNRRRQRANPLMGAVAGGVAGLVGAWMMVRFNHLMDPGTGTSDKAGDRYEHHRRNARPNDTDGTIPDEPGSMQAADALAAPVLGRGLTEREKEIGGPILHYAFGAAVGALYGAAAEADDSTTRGAGIPYGVAVWLVADEIGMHAAGFASSPADYPLSRHAATLATHIVFGLSVETVRRLLRGSPARSPKGPPLYRRGPAAVMGRDALRRDSEHATEAVSRSIRSSGATS